MVRFLLLCLLLRLLEPILEAINSELKTFTIWRLKNRFLIPIFFSEPHKQVVLIRLVSSILLVVITIEPLSSSCSSLINGNIQYFDKFSIHLFNNNWQFRAICWLCNGFLTVSRRNRLHECSMMIMMMNFVVEHHERRSTFRATAQLEPRFSSVDGQIFKKILSERFSLQLIERNKRIQLQNLHPDRLIPTLND